MFCMYKKISQYQRWRLYLDQNGLLLWCYSLGVKQEQLTCRSGLCVFFQCLFVLYDPTAWSDRKWVKLWMNIFKVLVCRWRPSLPKKMQRFTFRMCIFLQVNFLVQWYYFFLWWKWLWECCSSREKFVLNWKQFIATGANNKMFSKICV